VPFTSQTKRELACFKDKDTFRILLKGAPDVLLGMCNRELRGNADPVELTKERIDVINAQIAALSNDSQRGILCCHKVLSAEEYDDLQLSDEESKRKLECNMVLTNIFGLKDPLRPNVRESVARLH